MVDSALVLHGQTIAYTAYTLLIMSLMVWFAVRITRAQKGSPVSNGLFYAWIVFLVVLGVSLHIATAKTIPWKELDLHRAHIKPDKHFVITVEDHKFTLPADTLYVDLHDKVLFDVTSKDLTYGFGLFRKDNSMLFQMQVVPGHRNDILWEFVNPGVYTIRSTEYSGPEGIDMILKDVVVVK